jgi:transcriptional regulator with XRE-family HTH domain
MKTLRRRHGLTQSELADLAGVHRVTVARFERGYVPDWGRSLTQVAKALGVPVAELVPDGGAYPNEATDDRNTEAPQRSRAA